MFERVFALPTNYCMFQSGGFGCVCIVNIVARGCSLLRRWYIAARNRAQHERLHNLSPDNAEREERERGAVLPACAGDGRQDAFLCDFDWRLLGLVE